MHRIKLTYFQKITVAALCILTVCAVMLSAMIIVTNEDSTPGGVASFYPIPSQAVPTASPVVVTLSPILETSATKAGVESSASTVVTPLPSPNLTIPKDEEAVEAPKDMTEKYNPYAELELTNSEKKLLARMAYSEAGNQSFEGQVAVILVALNRCIHPAFPSNISDVLFAPHQFVVGRHYEDEQMEAVEAALAGEPVLDLNTDVVFFSTGSLRYGSYYKTIGDHVFRTYS